MSQAEVADLFASLSALLYPESRDSPALGLVCGFGQWGMRKRVEKGRSVGPGAMGEFMEPIGNGRHQDGLRTLYYGLAWG